MEKAKAAQAADFPEGLPECGADALRFGLMAYTIQGRDVNLDIKRIVGYRQFCNKVWNACKFAIEYIVDFQPTATMHLEIPTHAGVRNRDLSILSKLNNTIIACNTNMQAYLFGNVSSALYSFFLYDLCDVYLELIKPVIKIDAESTNNQEALDMQYVAQATLFTCLEHFLRLCHPLMPFVTEELWQRLPNIHSEAMSSVAPASIMIAKYPQETKVWASLSAEQDSETIATCVHDARSLRTDYKIANHTKANFYFRADNAQIQQAIEAQANDFCTLAKGNFLKYLPPDAAAPKNTCIKVVNESLSLLVDLTGLIDIDQELIRLGKEKQRLIPMLEQYRRKMSAADYETKVPEAVQKSNAEKLSAYESELEATDAAIANFEKMRL